MTTILNYILYPMNKINEKLINAFLKRDRENVKNDLDSYKTIYSAARAENCYGIKHHHQRRINPSTLESFARKIQHKENELENTQSFNDIYKIIAGSQITGIGRLTIYDTAVRIAHLKGFKPDNVHLQQGASWGARKLDIHKKQEDKAIFNKLGLENLETHEIECFLCIYNKCLDCSFINSCLYIINPLITSKKGICKR